MTTTTPHAPKKLAILRAAQRLFATHSFSKVSMDDIAREIGMAKASLYYYFATKEDLFRAVIASEQDELLRRTTAVVDSDLPAGEKLMAFVERRFAYFRTVANLSKLSYLSLIEMKPIFGTLHADLADREISLIRRMLRDGKASGAFHLEDVEPMARLFLHIIQGLRARLFREIARTASVADEKMYRALRQEMRLATRVFVAALGTTPADAATHGNSITAPPRAGRAIRKQG